MGDSIVLVVGEPEAVQALKDLPAPNVKSDEFCSAWDSLRVEEELTGEGLQTQFRFRSVPTIKEAVLLPRTVTPLSFLKAPEWFREALLDGRVRRFDDGQWQVVTIEGTMETEAGNFILRGLEGELYACKADIFRRSYEPAPIE